MKPFYTYILKCADGLYYTGHTDNIDLRIAQHQSGHFPGCFTAKRLPVTVMWATDFSTRDEAFAAEAIIKKWSRAKKEAMMRGDWDGVSFFARPPKERDLGVSTSLDMSGVREDMSGVGEDISGVERNGPSKPAHVERSRDTVGRP